MPLQNLRLRNFRGFRNFELSFKESNFLVGPNNAGKSTILSALRMIEAQLRVARAKIPTLLIDDGGIRRPAYPMSLDEFAALAESARYDLGTAETRVTAKWSNGNEVCLRWPEDKGDQETDSPHFFLSLKNGFQPRRPLDVRANFEVLGIVPTLGPVETEEAYLVSDNYVRGNVWGHLSSRHFRNQLWRMKDTPSFREYLDFANEWTSELQLVDLIRKYADGAFLDLFYREGVRHHEREIAWAGDGLQVWLQILFHVYRTRDLNSIVLDEPEVFLHPDLQRRLARLLQESGRQLIVATHSSELLAEAASSAVVLVDRTLPRGRRIKDDSGLAALGDQIGSQFNLGIAKALKSRVAVFVEGKDSTLLRTTARTLKLGHLSLEADVAFIQMDGFSGWEHVNAFTWLCRDMLKESVKPYVILDRDYKSDLRVNAVVKEFQGAGIAHHIWRKKELENYYLSIDCLSRLTKMSIQEVSAVLVEVTNGFRTKVSSRIAAERMATDVGPKHDRAALLHASTEEFEAQWNDLQFRLDRCPAKEVLAKFNEHLQGSKKRALSFRSLAWNQELTDIDPELSRTLEDVENLILSQFSK